MAFADRVSARSAGTGIVAGAVAWFVGYVGVYLTQSGDVENRLATVNPVLELLGGDPLPTWKAVGWFFYNVHFVETEIPVLGGTLNRTFLPMEGSQTLLYVLAPVALVGAGFAIAARFEATDANSTPILGSLVVLGYLPLSILGIFVFGYEVGTGTIAPDPVVGILLAGVAYPLVFGTIGGLFAGEV